MTAPPRNPDRSARSIASSSISPPRATLMIHAPCFAASSESSLMRRSVSAVSGRASTTKSDVAIRAGSASRPPITSTPSTGSASGRRRMATTREPNGLASLATSPPMPPRPTSPIVTPLISCASSGCHVRSRWSSMSCGRRRQTARIMVITYSAIGRLKTPWALVTVSPRRRTHGVRTDSTPTETEWIQRSLGARPTNRSSGSPPSDQPRSRTSTSSSDSSAWPSELTGMSLVPGAAARISSFIDPKASRPVRTGLIAIARGEPPGPCPGPTVARLSAFMFVPCARRLGSGRGQDPCQPT